MALKQADKDKLKAFGLDVDKLVEAITATEETDFEVPEVTVLTTAQLTERDNNKLAEGKRAGEAAGETKGKELAAKAFKRKFSLDDAIPADIDKVVEAVNTKLNKGDAALQEQVAGLLKDKETLTATIAEKEAAAKQAFFDAELISMFPAGRGEDLSDAERLALIKMNFQFEETDGKKVVKRNGAIVQDPSTHAPLELKKVVGDFFTEKKWTGQAPGAGGRGGGDNTGGGAGFTGVKSASKFAEKWKAENPGKNEMSSEYIDALNKHAKEVPDFNMYE